MGSKLDQAHEKAARAAELIAEWQGKTERLEAELAIAMDPVSVGASLVGDEEAAARIASLREEHRIARSTFNSAVAARDACHREAYLAEASELRSEADRLDVKAQNLRDEAAQLEAKCRAEQGA